MDNNRYVALLAADYGSSSATQRSFLEILNYLDDRHWPVTVWNHNRQNAWLRKNRLLANIWYALRLFLLPPCTIIVDHRLYPYCFAALALGKKITPHTLLLHITKDFWPLAGFGKFDLWSGMWRRGMQNADVVIVDSAQTRYKLLELGLAGSRMRLLHPLQSFMPLIFKQELLETEDTALQAEEDDAVQVPQTLVEAFEQLDLERLLLPIHRGKTF
ncbi:glycosyltransferase [candidate division FCPU426 bacterium]|nr:glycosyltransferase [candidate division FCPU426 bacterium]